MIKTKGNQYVAIDYSKKAAFTLGAVTTNFGRFDLKT